MLINSLLYNQNGAKNVERMQNEAVVNAYH